MTGVILRQIEKQPVFKHLCAFFSCVIFALALCALIFFSLAGRVAAENPPLPRFEETAPAPLPEQPSSALPGRPSADFTTSGDFTTSADSAPSAAQTPIPPRGAKAESNTESGTARGGFSAFLQTLAKLALVLAAIFGFFYLAKKFSPKQKISMPDGVVETVGERPLTAKVRMRLVRFGPKLLLLAVSGDRVETLSELTDPTEVAQTLERCRPGGKK